MEFQDWYMAKLRIDIPRVYWNGECDESIYLAVLSSLLGTGSLRTFGN
jgi:hypothetical protein